MIGNWRGLCRGCLLGHCQHRRTVWGGDSGAKLLVLARRQVGGSAHALNAIGT